MRTITFSLFILLYFFSCSEYEKEDYVLYHHQKIVANFHIINKQFDSAQIVFDRLFQKYPKHFYKDVHNACLCEIELDNYTKALNYAKELVLQGYEMVDFERNSFKGFRNSNLWQEFELEYPKLRQRYLKKQNHKLRNRYYELFLLDQKAAGKYGGCDRDELYKVYFNNAKVLHSLYLEKGLPDFLRNKDTLNLKYWTFFRHYFGMKNIINNSEELRGSYQEMKFDSLNWKIILLNELHNGNLSPEFYSQVVSYHDPRHPFGKCAIRLNFKTEKVELFTPLPKNKANLVNKNRQEIGLMPYTELNSDILKSTWYAHYPFKKIKEAYLSCDTCATDADYFEILARLEKDAEMKYTDQDVLSGFLFDDYKGLKKKWLEDISEYQLNLKDNDSCDKPK